MNLDEATPQEQQFAALLAAFDEALASGGPPPGSQAPAELQPRLREDLDCLHLLNHLRSSSSDPRQVHVPLDLCVAEPAERYKLVRRHAAGGIGQVWLAYDADLRREVALKELRSERACNPAIAARFLREARVTGQLQHPGIVPVYELVPGSSDPLTEAGDEGPFYTMRFVQGRTLTDAARAYHEKRAAGKAGALDRTALLNVFVSVCNTVAYAHSRGVIHRDLKGQNVVLGDFGEVMVLDWGFAKLVGQAEAEELGAGEPDAPLSAELTHAGQVLGTPAYMSPEQASGRHGAIDFRTDVYGLGAILYEILTGQPPFAGDDGEEVLRKVRTERPPRPQTRSPGVPPALAAVCLKALAHEPANRYPTATDLGREVQHWLADEPVTAYREPMLGRFGRWTRRHKPIVVGGVVLFFSTLAALMVGTVLIEQEHSNTVATRLQAAAEKAESQVKAQQALEAQLYFHRIALVERELAANNLNRATQLLAACPKELRGWEWHLLRRLCHDEPRLIRGHDGPVAAVAFSPDGRYLAGAGHDRTVRIWDVTTWKPVQTLTGHTDIVYGLAFNPDGDRLATAGWDREVKIWDPVQGRLLHTCRGHTQPVWRVAFSPDGQQVASLSSSSVKIWDAETGAEIRTLGSVGGLNRYGLAYSPDGRILAVTTHAPSVVLWDVSTGKQVLVFRGHTSVVKNVAFSPDGRLIASGAGDLARSEPGKIKLWEAATGHELFELRGHTDPIYAVAFSPDGKRLASSSQDHTVKIWDPGSGREILTLRAHQDTVRGVAFSPNGCLLASACVDGSIKVWDATPWADEKPTWETRTLAGHGAAVFSIAFFPDGQHLVALSDNEIIRTWDPRTGGELSERRMSVEPQIYALALNPDGTLLATATTNGTVRILDPITRQIKSTLRGHASGPVKSLAFSPDGRRLAMAHWDRTIWVWDVITGKPVHTLHGHGDAVIGVAFSPDGKKLASASYDQSVRLWDSATGQLLRVLVGHTSRVSGVAFSPDGQTLASASNDGTIRLWDPEQGEVRRVLEGHVLGVYGLAFTPDGRCLASASSDWTVKLWKVSTGAVLHTLRGHTDRVHAVAFSPDGKFLASASSDQTVNVWEVPVVDWEAGDKGDGQE